jgi:hypothetical protein
LSELEGAVWGFSFWGVLGIFIFVRSGCLFIKRLVTGAVELIYTGGIVKIVKVVKFVKIVKIVKFVVKDRDSLFDSCLSFPMYSLSMMKTANP